MGTSAFYPVPWGDCPHTTTGGKGWELPRSTLFLGETVHTLQQEERDGNFRVLPCSLGRLSTHYNRRKGVGTSAFYPVPWGDCLQTTTGGKGWNFRVLPCSLGRLSTDYNRRKGMELLRFTLFLGETVHTLQQEERDGNFRVLPCSLGSLSTDYSRLTKVSELLGNHHRG